MKRTVFSFSLFLSIIFMSACQPPVLVQKGVVVNKTNPNFLKDAGVEEFVNPHKDSNCKVCHLAPADLLKKAQPSPNEQLQRKQMRTDLIALCATCHKAKISNEHRVGMSTRLNKDNLPLDHNGNITCATTCHDIHTEKPEFKQKMIRKLFDDLCFSCHEV